MMRKGWIPLTHYSSKYNVSVSTLRRRIKAQQVEFVYKEGKVLLIGYPLESSSKKHRQGFESPSGTYE